MGNKKKIGRSILIISAVLSAAIVGGLTFSWFISKDGVVNRISASGNYDVVAVEDFIPPLNWIPGQEVKKEVRAANTGDIGAFVKSMITGDLILTRFAKSSSASDLTNAFELTTDSSIVAKQAGGLLVYSPNTTDYNQTDLETSTVGVSVASYENALPVSSLEFVPDLSGYYIFARVKQYLSLGEITTSITYDGYYFDSDSNKYYDIEVGTAGDGSDINRLYALAMQTETIMAGNDQFIYTLNDDNTILTAKYDPDYDPATTDEIPADDGNEIIIEIAIDNIGNSGDTWICHVTEPASLIGSSDTTGRAAAFYYNRVLDGGAVSNNFITSVTLSDTVSKNSFITMDYNLKVTVQSAQITANDEMYTAVNEQDWAKTTNGAYKVTDVQNGNVTWQP